MKFPASCLHVDNQAETTSPSKTSWELTALAAPGHSRVSGEGWSPLMAHRASIPVAGAAMSSRQGKREGKAWKVTAPQWVWGRGAQCRSVTACGEKHRWGGVRDLRASRTSLRHDSLAAG